MSDEKSVAIEPYFGGFVLETLTVGMYGEARNAIREYVQNGFDSIQRAIDLKQLPAGKGLIEVEYLDSEVGLVIRDNGAGLPVELAGKTLVAIGASRKDYRSDAGFRGIGRLAGIVFSNKVIFRTKAKGEAIETEVTFDAETLRERMAPGQGSERTAEQLLRECVQIKTRSTEAERASFFEVKLLGFTEAPDECSDPKAMETFLSQVAPVPYSPTFPHAAEVRKLGKKYGLPVEDVRLEIIARDKRTEVFKPFKADYQIQDAVDRAPLEDIQEFGSPTSRWWGWLGRKATPGNYLEADVRGIRVRAKNIQIDGTDVIREIFQKRSQSSARYNDWFIGEIFVDLKSLTPNARRDGFEDTPGWREVQMEIAASVCKDAGSSAQSISNKGQFTVETLAEKTRKAAETLASLRKANFKNQDKTLALSAETTKIHADVAKALRNAQPTTSVQLQQLAAQLIDTKTEALRHVEGTGQKLDREQIEADARLELLGELLVIFEDRLQASCLSAVRNLIESEYGYTQK